MCACGTRGLTRDKRQQAAGLPGAEAGGGFQGGRSRWPRPGLRGLSGDLADGQTGLGDEPLSPSPRVLTNP